MIKKCFKIDCTKSSGMIGIEDMKKDLLFQQVFLNAYFFNN